MPERACPALIPPGMRAVSVRVNEVVSVAGFVTPGTRVDVLLTGAPNGRRAADHDRSTERCGAGLRAHIGTDCTGEAQNTAVITLLVTPDDAQRLTLASSEGHIQLSLRNPSTRRPRKCQPPNARGPYKGMPAPPSTTPAPVRHAAASEKSADHSSSSHRRQG